MCWSCREWGGARSGGWRGAPWVLGTLAVALAMLLPAAAQVAADEVLLPSPRLQGPVSIEAALAQRRSVRQFAAQALRAADVAQLLWAAQGISDAQGRRTAPSAGATYPLVLYLVAGRVDGMAPGVYRYRPQAHRLELLMPGDPRAAVAAAASRQGWAAQAPALVLITSHTARTAARYGARAERYAAIEAGAAAQNLLLQATAAGLGATLIGAFDEAALRRDLPLPAQEQPLALIAVGHRP